MLLFVGRLALGFNLHEKHQSVLYENAVWDAGRTR